MRRLLLGRLPGWPHSAPSSHIFDVEGPGNASVPLVRRPTSIPPFASRRSSAARTGVSGGLAVAVRSGCGAVLVDESTAGRVSLDRLGRTNPNDVGACRCALSERPVRPMLVVMGHVLRQQRPQLTFVPDDGAVQQLVKGGIGSGTSASVAIGSLRASSVRRRRLPWVFGGPMASGDRSSGMQE